SRVPRPNAAATGPWGGKTSWAAGRGARDEVLLPGPALPEAVLAAGHRLSGPDRPRVGGGPAGAVAVADPLRPRAREPPARGAAGLAAGAAGAGPEGAVVLRRRRRGGGDAIVARAERVRQLRQHQDRAEHDPGLPQRPVPARAAAVAGLP